MAYDRANPGANFKHMLRHRLTHDDCINLTKLEVISGEVGSRTIAPEDVLISIQCSLRGNARHNTNHKASH
jgi:hypothetical protein